MAVILPSLSTLTGSPYLNRASKYLKNLQDFSNLGCWLTCFEIHNETDANARDASKLVLSQVLLLADASDQGANVY